ncbi:hypothetical protein HMPREF3150_01595 [Pseudomonas aeruginosa]|nr:hypothetical protein HMPREF3150_01595 [Pseudomonas aeruginosa]
MGSCASRDTASETFPRLDEEETAGILHSKKCYVITYKYS